MKSVNQHTNTQSQTLLFFFIGELQGAALPYWRLDAKCPYLLSSSKLCGPWIAQSSRTEGLHQPAR